MRKFISLLLFSLIFIFVCLNSVFSQIGPLFPMEQPDKKQESKREKTYKSELEQPQRQKASPISVISFTPLTIAGSPVEIKSGESFYSYIEILSTSRRGAHLKPVKNVQSFNGFIEYNPDTLIFLSAETGQALKEQNWNIESKKIEPGKIRISLNADTGNPFSGIGRLIRLQFKAKENVRGNCIFTLTGYRFSPIGARTFAYNGLLKNTQGQSIAVTSPNLPPNLGISGFVQVVPEQAGILSSHAETNLLVIYFPKKIVDAARRRECNIEILKKDSVIHSFTTYDLQDMYYVFAENEKGIKSGDTIRVRYSIQGHSSWENPEETNGYTVASEEDTPLNFSDYRPLEITDITLMRNDNNTTDLSVTSPATLLVATNGNGPTAVSAVLETKDGRQLQTLLPLTFNMDEPPKISVPELISKGDYNLIITAVFLFDLTRTTAAQRRIEVTVK